MQKGWFGDDLCCNEIRDKLTNLAEKAFTPSEARNKPLMKPSRIKSVSEKDAPTKDTSQERAWSRLLVTGMNPVIFQFVDSGQEALIASWVHTSFAERTFDKTVRSALGLARPFGWR